MKNRLMNQNIHTIIWVVVFISTFTLLRFPLGANATTIFWTTTRDIFRADADEAQPEMLSPPDLSFLAGISLDNDAKKIYWIDFVASKIQRANLDGTFVEDIISTGLAVPWAIAVNSVEGKIYWTDIETDKIQRANLNGTAVEDIIDIGLLNPRGIAVDSKNEKIYWTDAGTGKIQRANLDGTAVEDIVTTGLIRPEGIAIDVENQKIYWVDSDTAIIQRSNLDGTSVENVIITGLMEPKGLAIDSARRKIYWTDSSSGKIQRANFSGTGFEDVVTDQASPQYIALEVEALAPEVQYGYAKLSGDQEIPIVVTNAAGTAALWLDTDNSLHYNITLTGLSGPIVGAHFHGPAAESANAGVIFGITGTFNGNHAEGTWEGMTDEQLGFLMDGLLYLNIHTLNNPPGEIRGQVHMGNNAVILLSGDVEVPPVETNAVGTGFLKFTDDRQDLEYSMTLAGLEVGTAHFHAPAAVGEKAADAIFGITGSFKDNHAEGVWTDFTSEQLQYLIDEQAYVQIHTNLHPGGELRGQVVGLKSPTDLPPIPPPVPTAEFTLSALILEMTHKAGESATYILKVEGQSGAAGVITLFATEDLPTSQVVFAPKQVTISELQPLVTSQLTLTLPDNIAPGNYPFTILAVPDNGQVQRATLTLIVESATLTPTSLTLITQPEAVALRQPLNLLGSLVSLTGTDTLLDGLPIQIIFTAPSGTTENFEVATDVDGNYQLTTPFLPDEVGPWTVKVQFSGNGTMAASERERTFDVTKGIAEITFDSGTTGALGTSFEVLGQLTPQEANQQLTLKILRPDNAASTLTGITTETLGVFRNSIELVLPGEWEITVTWAGNDKYENTTETFKITVSKEVGKAILVLGGGNQQDNPAWLRFNGLAEYVHNILLQREFDDQEDIQFLSPDPNQTVGADAVTSQTALEFAITNWARSRVNAQVPLFIYLLSHNLEDRFLLDKRGNSETFLSPDLLAEWLNELPEDTPVTIVIEACHSGNFIKSNGIPSPLVGPNRTILVSAKADKQAKITPTLSSFSKVFFDQIATNLTVAEAFRTAQATMLVLRLHRSQLPEMDANGNGQVNEPQDFAVLAKRFIPADIVSLADPPEFIKLTEPTTLPKGTSSLRIEAELLGVGINNVVATVIPPGFDSEQRFDDWDALAFDQFDLGIVDEGKYAATYGKFTQPGEYVVTVNAANIDGSADPVQTTITVPGDELAAFPWDVNSDGVVNVFDLVGVASQFGSVGADFSGDVNGDGAVNVFDMVAVGAHFGETAPSE